MTSLFTVLTLSSGLAQAECQLDMGVPETRRVLEACGYDEAADLLQTWKRGMIGAVGLGALIITAQVGMSHRLASVQVYVDLQDGAGVMRDRRPGCTRSPPQACPGRTWR